MNEINKDISVSLIDSIKKSELSSLAPDLIEIGFDKLLEDSIIKEIPVIRTFQAVYRTVITISDKMLIKKIILFLNRVNDLPKEEIDEFYSRLENDPKFKMEIGEKILLILEKSDDYGKSYMLAEIFKNYIKGKIDYATFQLLCNAINTTFIIYLKNLKEYYEALHNSVKVDREILENLFQSGLVSIESHMIISSNGILFKPNNVGSLLIKILFNNGV